MIPGIFQAVGPWLERYGEWALFLLVFIEGFGIPAPGETMIIASGLLAWEGKLPIWPVLLIAWGAAVLGDNIGFAIGHYGGSRLVLHLGHWVGVGPPQLARAEGFFNRWGGPVVALARFVDGPRQLNGLIAGSSGMHWWKFLAFNMVGAALWVGLWGGGVYLAGHRVELLLSRFKQGEHYAIAVALLAVLLFLLVHFYRRHRDERHLPR